jgi:transglutaminase-like putative cysteine protease
MPVLTVQHDTTYSYRRPVGFGEHRMMFRPRDSADQKLLSWELLIRPRPLDLRSLLDTQGNVITVARFSGRSKELHFSNKLVVEHAPVAPSAEKLAPYARSWPFTYDLDDMNDLSRTMERHYPDPDHAVDGWVRSIFGAPSAFRGGGIGTLDLLSAMTEEIRTNFTYTPRFEEGMQEPARTLALRNGTCRDYAVLMMEAVRALGFAARFVSGYLYVPDQAGHIGGGNTHAWVQVYLPGAGWVEFDPTNGIIGNKDLIRVAVARDPRQAIPLWGTWSGTAEDSLGMDVSVDVAEIALDKRRYAAG